MATMMLPPGLEPPPGLEAFAKIQAGIEEPALVTPAMNSRGKKPLDKGGKSKRAKPKEKVPQAAPKDSLCEVAYVPLPPGAVKDLKVGFNTNHPGLLIKAATPSLELSPDGASAKVVLNGLPKQLSSNVMFQAILQQSGFEEHIVEFDLKSGQTNVATGGKDHGVATIYFRDFCMATMCMNHFKAASWMPNGATIKALPVTGAKLIASAPVDTQRAALSAAAPAFIPLRQGGSVGGRGLPKQQQRLHGGNSDASTEVSSIAEVGDVASERDDEEGNTQHRSNA